MEYFRVACALAICVGCSGRLTVTTSEVVNCTVADQCGKGRVCDVKRSECIESAGSCSATVSDGDCPIGRTCLSGGICACSDLETCECTNGDCEVEPNYCQCAEGLACTVEGVCTEVTDENRCSPSLPNGLCEGGEVCVGGGCVPIDAGNACAPTRPSGLCSAGLVCDEGYCIPATDRACSEQVPDGICPAGQACSEGSCSVSACSETALFGACDVDERCLGGECVPLPCGELHPAGGCDTGFYCASGRECIRVGECATEIDCEAGQYCSVPPAELVNEPPVCVAQPSCRYDDDCLVIQGAGQGYACSDSICVPRVNCVEDVECFPDDFCSSGGICRPQGGCDSTADCKDEEFCSGSNLCTPNEQCRVDEDCKIAGEFCSRIPENAQCIAVGTCLGNEDCAPGRACASGVCEVVAASCTSNAVEVLDVDGNAGLVCPNGDTCCGAGEFCSFSGTPSGLCLALGLCRDDSDCTGGFVCDGQFRCVAADDNACVSDGDCTDGEFCSLSGGCLAVGSCAVDADCRSSERCGGEYVCLPDPTSGCGADSFDLGSFLSPNVMFVVDRSASMQLCGPGEPSSGVCGDVGDDGHCCSNAVAGEADPACGGCDSITGFFDAVTCGGVCSHNAMLTCVDDVDCGGAPNTCRDRDSSTVTTRWEEARDAINAVVASEGVNVSFGLARYPSIDPSNTCDLACNWWSCETECPGPEPCTTRGFLDSGIVDVPVEPASSVVDSMTGFTPIGKVLEETYPGGATPTQPTLRTIALDPGLGGLNALDRANAVILVTDGQARGGAVGVGVCAPNCADGLRSTSETDIDCGGLCPACAVGQTCESDLDCQGDATCPDGTCRAATCLDGIQNNGETDVDCGGGCTPCDTGDACNGAADCNSSVCTGTVCVQAACDDLQQNGVETDVDCGGNCPTKCTDGQGCANDTDCQSGVCQDGECRPVNCGNSMQDSGESGSDCGGDCAACPPIFPSHCANNIIDEDETDIDCGGSCAPCQDGFSCYDDGVNDDINCASQTCSICPEDDPITVDVGEGEGCKVNAALDRLYAINNRIRTFVVGFAFSAGDAFNDELNCYAAHGRTARQEECPAVTTNSCANPDGGPDPDPACYFTANDTPTLVQAFGDIVDDVRTCTYDVSTAPFSAAPSTSSVYLNVDSGGEPSFVPVRRSEWTYRSRAKTIEFFGDACSQLLAGTASPFIVYGCVGSGG